MDQNISLKNIIEVIRGTGGFLVFPDENGDEYVVASREDFESAVLDTEEIQLSLPDSSEAADGKPSADDMLEKINRDIALFQLQQAEEEEENFDEINSLSVEDGIEKPVLMEALETSYAAFSEEVKPGDRVEASRRAVHQDEPRFERRVRFEPLKGDLPPELQD